MFLKFRPTSLAAKALLPSMLLATLPATHSAAHAQMIALPGGTIPQVFGVSPDGAVAVGTTQVFPEPWQVVRWTNPVTGNPGEQLLGKPAWGDGANGVAVSDTGVIAVNASFVDPSIGFISLDQVYRWTDPATGGHGFQEIGVLPGLYSSTVAHAISADGTLIVGGARWRDTSSHVVSEKPFQWRLTNAATGAGSLTELPLLPGDDWGGAGDVSADGRVIVGMSWNSTTQIRHDVRWIDGIIEEVPGGPGTAQFVSDDGTIIFAVGTDAAGSPAWFRWTPATGWEVIHSFVAGCCTVAIKGVSGDGSIVVGHRWTGRDAGAWVWEEAGGFQSLRKFLGDKGVDLSGWTSFQAMQIAGNGKSIVGLGTGPSRSWIARFDAPCYADCDQSTGAGVLDVFDFLCFQNSFVNGETYACDCDTSTGPLVCDVFDFLCFQNAFVGGCP